MPDPRPQSNYKCSQSELYAICTIGWTSFGENQADFELFNTLYTIVFGTDALAEVDAAMNLPGFQERNEAAETAYIEMTKAHAECILRWKSLRSYIKNSYPTELQKPKIESAGYDHYTKAANKNWDETKLLLTAGQHFIDNNTADLTTGGMPPTFAADYALADTTFSNLYVQFTDFEQDEQEETDTKVEANNAIYAKLLKMLEDANIIYEHDASKRERFIFAQIKTLITNTGNTSTTPADTVLIEGVVTDQSTGDPIQDASVNVTPDGSIETFGAVTDELGFYVLKVTDLAPKTAGTFLINAEALDHNPVSIPLNYETGKKFKLEIKLKEFIEPEPPVPPIDPEDPEPPVEP
jgi:hypothetical protein